MPILIGDLIKSVRESGPLGESIRFTSKFLCIAGNTYKYFTVGISFIFRIYVYIFTISLILDLE